MDAHTHRHALNPAELPAQIRRYSRKYGLFRPGPVVIGVSGGVDSLVLLHLLRLLSVDFQITLHVATLDHGLRGADGTADAEFVRQTAEAWSIPVIVGQVDVTALAKAQRMGIEAAARKARYRFLIEVAQSVGASQIAVAHHRDDQAETVLMHLLRGSGLAGLRGMLPATTIGDSDRFRLVRPLLDTSRATVDSYAALHGLIPRLDATNADPKYARNRIRLEILPLLRTINPALEMALAHTAEIARADYEALQWALTAKLPDWPLAAKRAVFQTLPRGLQRLAVHQLASEWPFAQVEALLDWLLKATVGDWRGLPDGATLLVTFDQLLYAPASDRSFLAVAAACPTLTDGLPVRISLPDTVDLASGWQLAVTQSLLATDTSPDWTDPFSVTLSVPPGAAILLRTRQPGDRFTPKGLNGHSQKLSDTLIDLKVPAAWRDRLPLLIVNDQIAWFVAATPDGVKARVADRFIWRHGHDPANNWRFTFRAKAPLSL